VLSAFPKDDFGLVPLLPSPSTLSRDASLLA